MSLLNSLAGKINAIKNSLTLEAQIAIGAAVLTTLLTGTLAVSAASFSYSSMSKLISRSLSEAATATTRRLDDRITANRKIIEALSQVNAVEADGTFDVDALRAKFEQMKRINPDFAWLGIANREGNVVASTGGVLQGTSVAGHTWFRTGLRQLSVTAAQSREGNAIPVGHDGPTAPQVYIDISSPVKDSAGAVIGVIGTHLSRNWIRTIITETEDTDGNGVRDSSIDLIASNGAPGHPNPSTATRYGPAHIAQTFRARFGSFIDKINDPSLVTVFRTGGAVLTNKSSWIVKASQPAGPAVEAALRTARDILLIGAGLGVLGIFAALLMARRVSQPIAEMTREADQIGRTPGATTLLLKGGSYEVVQLSHALRSLLLRLDFAEQHSRTLELQAMANAVEMRADLTRMQRLASTDELTELLNRRAFVKAATTVMADAAAANSDIAIMMIDIDLFKSINDRYGHIVGDQVIKQVASIIRREISDDGYAARFGGEEFIVLLLQASANSAADAAERIRRAIASTAIIHNGEIVSITASIGVTLTRDTDRDLQDVIERADRGLYQAKQSGRDCVVPMTASPATATEAI